MTAIYGRVAAPVIGAGRKPHRRFADLMIASIAIAEGLPLFTTNPKDFVGIDALLTIVSVDCPGLKHENSQGCPAALSPECGVDH
jgi:hypothetical protein